MQSRRRRRKPHLKSSLPKFIEQLESKHMLTAPVAVDDQYDAIEDTQLTIDAPGLMSNDFDPDGDAIIAFNGSSPATLGTVTVDPTGSFVYTPPANYSGPDTFTYFLFDQNSEPSNFATVTINVVNVNDPPTTVADGYLATEDTLLTVPSAGVFGLLNNDTDPENNPLTAVLVAQAEHGVVTLSPDGSFTYQPDPDYSGPDSFLYQSYDGSLYGNVVTVSLSVTAENDDPVALDDAFTTDEDTPLTILAAELTENDTDADGNALLPLLNVNATHGNVVVNPDGSFTYTPVPNYNGPDSFTYFVTDGAGTSNIATVNLTVTAVNDAPTAVDNGYVTNEDTALTVDAPGILANDTDPEGSSLTALLVSNPTNGTLSFQSDGSFVYTPDPNFNGTDSFTYRAFDGTAAGNVATVTILVNAENDAPVAVGDSYTTAEDTPLTIGAPGVQSNDSDPDGTAALSFVVDHPTHGTLALATDGSFVYTPALNYNGPDSFTYFLTDGALFSSVVTVNLIVTPVNDVPVATDVSFATSEDTPLIMGISGVLGYASDADRDTLTAEVAQDPANGTLQLFPNGSFIYTPNPNFNGIDTFKYRANDGTADSNEGTVTIIVNAVNDAPVGVDDNYSTDEDTPLNITAPGVLGNDTDVEGGPLTADFFSQPEHGTVVLNSDGSFTYTPDANYNGLDSFTYQAFDGNATSPDVTVNITVNSVPDTPVALDDAYTTVEDTPLNIAAPGLLENDTDGDGDTITPTVVDQPLHGTVTVQDDGSFIYTPEANYNGPDSFTYTVSDGSLTSLAATVSLTITAVDDAPVALDDVFSTLEDTPLNVTAPGILTNDSDVEGASVSALLVSNPAHGQLVFNADGSFTYTPDANYNGPDSFTYRAFDGALSSTIATVSLTVTAVNDAPVAVADSYTLAENSALTVAAAGVLTNDTDVEGSALTAIQVDGPAHGTLALAADGSFVYTPTANYNGSDSFTYRANDGTEDGNIVTVSLTITAVNTLPVVTVTPPSATQWLLIDNATVATFTDVDADEYPGSFTATIDWGDGSPSTSGVITRIGNTFEVAGSHIYATAGDFTLTVTVNDPAGGSAAGTGTITVAPLPAQFELGGDVSSGEPGDTPNSSISNSATPTITGTAPPGDVVTVFATPIGGGSPVAVGQAVAGLDGSFEITTNGLEDGEYTLTLSAYNPAISGPTLTATIGTVQIDTVSPTISALTMDPATGRILVTFQDVTTGVDLDTILDLDSYNVNRRFVLFSARNKDKATSVEQVSAEDGTVTVAVVINGGKRIRAGKFAIEVSGQSVMDNAGNLLSGSFDGSLPTSPDNPGTSLVARFTVRRGVASAPEASNEPTAANNRQVRHAARQARHAEARAGRHR